MSKFSKAINYVKVYGYDLFFAKLIVSIIGYFYKKEIFRNKKSKKLMTYFSRKKEDKIKKFLRDKMNEVEINTIYTSAVEGESNKTIWVMWWQGLNNAPDIVNVCILNLKNLHPNWKVIIVTKYNINEYIEEENDIKSMMLLNEISFTMFSDYVRLYLLDNYGGVWLDSTCFLTEKLSEDILEYSIYTSKGVLPNELTPRYPITSRHQIFFLYSKPNNLIIKKLHYYLYYFLLHGYGGIDYLLTYYLLEIILEDDNNCSYKYDLIPVNNINILQILNKLHMPMDDKIIEILNEKSTYIFKLTYKTKKNNEILQWIENRYCKLENNRY